MALPIPARTRRRDSILTGLEPSAGRYSGVAVKSHPFPLLTSPTTSAPRDAGQGRSWEEAILRTWIPLASRITRGRSPNGRTATRISPITAHAAKPPISPETASPIPRPIMMTPATASTIIAMRPMRGGLRVMDSGIGARGVDWNGGAG